MTEIDRIAALIERHALALGYACERARSGGGRSAYLHLARPGERGAAGLTVRVSDHKLPPGYAARDGRPDFEVGGHDGADGDWTDCLVELAHRAGREVPKAVQRARRIRWRKGG